MDITNADDVIDSRDVIDRITELESDLADCEVQDEIAQWQGEWGDVLESLRLFASQGEDSCSDWRYGEALVRDSYFITHAQELADDIGAIDANASWPLCHIDWEAAARDLQMDYTPIEFDGVTYWGRA